MAKRKKLTCREKCAANANPETRVIENAPPLSSYARKLRDGHVPTPKAVDVSSIPISKREARYNG